MDNPWTTAQIRSEKARPGGLQLVAERGGIIYGYAFFSTCLPEAELLRIGVSRKQQRQGCGAALLGAGLVRLGQAGAVSCFLEVRSSNRPARALYSSCGFVEIGRRPRYYSGPREDALLMEKKDMSALGREQ